MNYKIDQFIEEDIEQVVTLWRLVFKDQPLSVEALRKHTVLNPEFDPAGCFVAREKDTVVGFILATTMRIPEVREGEFPGNIPVIMVAPKHRNRGIGRELLNRGENYLKSQGKTKVQAGYLAYIRGTILSILGVNTKWKEAFWFFNHYGFRTTGIMDSAKVALDTFKVPDYVIERERTAAEQNIRADVLKREDESVFLDFLKGTFPENWYPQFARRIHRQELIFENVLVLRQDKAIIGFVGPVDISEGGIAALGIGIGLKKEFRGKGLGNIILFRSLEMIKNKGGKECYIFGVGPKRYYEKAGFRLADLWIMMEKEL